VSRTLLTIAFDPNRAEFGSPLTERSEQKEAGSLRIWFPQNPIGNGKTVGKTVFGLIGLAAIAVYSIAMPWWGWLALAPWVVAIGYDVIFERRSAQGPLGEQAGEVVYSVGPASHPDRTAQQEFERGYFDQATGVWRPLPQQPVAD
jgi:hypothetical protein